MCTIILHVGVNTYRNDCTPFLFARVLEHIVLDCVFVCVYCDYYRKTGDFSPVAELTQGVQRYNKYE